MKEKTVSEWLNELPEPIRTRAIENIIYQRGGKYLEAIRPQLALVAFFNWSKSKEKYDYWDLVSQGKYSEACALLGETLQTEQTEPHYMETAIDQAIREIANKEYGKFWVELDDSQKAHLVVPVAIRYAELVNNQKQ